MHLDQITAIDAALRLLSKPDWSYKMEPDVTDVTNRKDREAVQLLFHAVYGRPLDANTSGVHWLARAALLQAIAHTGFFRPRMSVLKVLFYVYSLASGVAGLLVWWYLFR